MKRRYVVLGLTLGLIALNLAEARGLIHPGNVIGEFGLKLLSLGSYFLTGTTFFLYRDRVRFTRVGLIVSAAVLFLALFRYASAAIFLPWLGTYLLLGLGFAPPLPGTAIVRRLDVSYGTYLYGWPIQELIISNWRDINPWLLFAISLPLSLGAGWLSWQLIEGPAMTWMGRRPANIHEPATTVTLPG
jgi:peptidoglycan/LPS O-acetylase OafA/YrhL